MTIWPRVQGSSGLNVVSLVPFVRPVEAAQRTAAAYQLSAGTSVKLTPSSTAGLPASRHRKTTICARVTVWSEPKTSALRPFVMPFSSAHATAIS